MRLALVGATGLVGSVMLEVLKERNLPVTELIPVGSQRSVGKTINWKGTSVKVVDIESALKMKPQAALFSAGSSVSRAYAKKFTNQGCYVIDNSSAWRLDADVPLIIPEVNGSALSEGQKLIANPNCSTIQLLMGVYPLYKNYGIRRMVISTYQSVTGSGVNAVRQLESERRGEEGSKHYPHRIDLNCLPHCDDFEANGYTKEEMKLVNESRKILSAPALAVSATAVRVPVTGGHSESVNLTLEKPFDLAEIRSLLSETPGVQLQDDTASNTYPMPVNAEGRDEVFVGRLRIDESFENSLNMWIVADNLRKGAATNAVQILESLIKLDRFSKK